MTTNPTRANVRTRIAGSPTVGGVAKPVTTSVSGPATISGAVMVSNRTPNNGAV